MKPDIEIARDTPLEKITEIAKKIYLSSEKIIPYGHYIAKVPLSEINLNSINKSNLILVTSISPTKAGIGKTTVSIGLALGLNKINKKAIVALREPSLGPCFGIKGGAAGGGYAQVLPMENINLHFTGDFHAITSAHNTLSALLDNYIFQNKKQANNIKEIVWKRVLDVNDRSLRYITTGLGGVNNGIPQENGFDITAASELMAIICLASDIDDLKRRVENIILGYRYDGSLFTVKDLGVSGAITVLLKDAIQPNLVQTTEHTAAFIHGGPFANIAHGCNSILATKMAMSYADYVITEAGFGADLGAEKFFNIKCRQANLQPKLTIIVVTAQGLKMHGGVNITDIKKENINGIRSGLKNLQKHINNLKQFGQTLLVAFNKYNTDTEDEINLIKEYCTKQNINFIINDAFSKGGNGAINFADTVIKLISETPSGPLNYTYDLTDSITEKITKIAKNIYGAQSVSFSNKAHKKIKLITENGMQHFPICIAKTQFSFSTDPKAYGVVKEFDLKISDLLINRGAEFIVALAGDIIRMPGLPDEPQALHIDFINGEIEGLS
jgi:formate--tetrahydrofolate ligase